MLLIHKASAGSGKTFSLARQYLVHILGQKMEDGRYRLRRKGERGLHRRILAITFTNKATEEMKSRIIHELAVLAGLEPGWDKDKKSPHLEYLTEKLDTTPDQIAEVSRVALKELLFDFNDFNVSTIDSFFQSVLRAFAHEAEVSGSYNVELDDTEVISSSVDSLLQDLNHTGAVEDTREIMRWLSLFMTKKIEDGSTFNIFNRSSGAFSGLVE
ncbi:MAG: UvrD-helicase domain-containing protein, partial [Duncaniella sp.]|nr:UvrD-helicase domain-containing protein [Duncaniella sp.]